MSTELIIPAALFSDEPVEREVIYNQDAIDEAVAKRDELLASEDEADVLAAAGVEIPEPQTIWWLMIPVTATIDAEYTKRRGLNESKLSYKPNRGGSGNVEAEFLPVDKIFSNERELSAIKWLAKQVLKGWRPFRITDGQTVEFSEHNLERLSEYPQYIKPACDEAYKISALKSEVELGNSETSFGGNATADEDQDGEHTGETAG